MSFNYFLRLLQAGCVVLSSIENSETPRAKILALKSSSEEINLNLDNRNGEISNICEEDEVEKETLQSMKVLKPYHFFMAEPVSSLEKIDMFR